MSREEQSGPELSLGRTLLGNWVEERQVASIDKNLKSIKSLHVKGHAGILTQGQNVTASTPISTCKDTFKNRGSDVVTLNHVGKRREMLEKELYKKVSEEVFDTLNPAPPVIDYTSTIQRDFVSDYTPCEMAPTVPRDINKEQPITFWSDNLKTIPGVTETLDDDRPFKRSAKFSTPTEEYAPYQ